MEIKVEIAFKKVSGGYTVAVECADAEECMNGVATTPHGATVQARKLVKELLEKIEPSIGKEGA